MHAPPHHADPDPWTERAACRDTDPEIFFPLPGASGGVDREAVAKRLCGRCPVARECLREALLHDEGAGIWGGFNARERRELLRIASTLESTAAELAAYLAGGGRRLNATPRERPAYVWYLRRHGWTPRRIAGALGVSFGQVQQAWQLAELAASCTRGPVSGMPNPRAPRKRVRRPGGGEQGVVGVERPEIRGGVTALGRTPLTGYGGRGAAPKRPQLPAVGGHPAGPVPADRRRAPLAADGRGVGGSRTQEPLAADQRGVSGSRTRVPLAAERRGAGGSRTPVPLGPDGRRVQGGGRVPQRRQVPSGAGPSAVERTRVSLDPEALRVPGPIPADRTRVRLAPMARRLPAGPRVTLTSSTARTFVTPGSPRITITIRPVPGTGVSGRGVS